MNFKDPTFAFRLFAHVASAVTAFEARDMGKYEYGTLLEMSVPVVFETERTSWSGKIATVRFSSGWGELGLDGTPDPSWVTLNIVTPNMCDCASRVELPRIAQVCYECAQFMCEAYGLDEAATKCVVQAASFH